MSLYTEITRCRVCGNADLRPLLDFGTPTIPGYVGDGAQPLEAPLLMLYCPRCLVAQLRHTVDRHVLYDHYYYRSGLNLRMVEELHNIAQEVVELAQPQPGDIVLDIGANDGTLLQAYPATLERVGVEPSRNLVATLEEKGIRAIPGFFSGASFLAATGGRKAKIITAIAMFYDLDQPQVFCADLAGVLEKKGVVIIQMNDLWSLFTQNTWDMIVHEHLCLYPLKAFNTLLDTVGLEVFDYEGRSINGGSGRYWIGHKGEHPVERCIESRLTLEAQLFTPEHFREYSERVKLTTETIKRLVQEEVERGGRVYTLAASTRGATILHACGLDKTLIRGASEIHPEKIGKRMAGLDIPIVSEEEARRDATAFLVLPYSYRNELIIRERAFLERGGKLIFPLPEPEVVQW